MRRLLTLLFTLLLGTGASLADAVQPDDTTYTALRDRMHRAFNEADSASFFPALTALEDYLLAQGDLHAYYTQRCNEIIFQMNRQKIFEAYKLAQRLSYELSERKLDKEMYMAINMMGHIYRICGNKESAKRCFREVIQRMEQAGYRESMPPIYMNIVNVEMGDHPDVALQLIDKAITIAAETSPERVFDMETRRTAAYYELGDTARFMEGYEAYKEGEAQGLSSVHGRALEVYHLAMLGRIDEAISLAREELGADSYDTQEKLFSDAGRWKEAYEMLKEEYKSNDSVNSVILSNSMQGIQDELRVYEAQRHAQQNRMLALLALLGLLLVGCVAMAYFVVSRRRHTRQLKRAYEHALESDNMKSAFIQNVSHEVRTPLNIISGFAQVMADPSLDAGLEERQHMALMVQKNTEVVTQLIDEMLELSHIESGGEVVRDEQVDLKKLLEQLIATASANLSGSTTIELQAALPQDFMMLTNATMLRRIVSTLLSNAVKYTQQGTITVSAQADGSQLTLVVEDTGCGIPESEAERIFDRFVKLDSFKVGIGLGLPLCRSCAQRLGGSVRLDTSYRQGARFIVSLPLA